MKRLVALVSVFLPLLAHGQNRTEIDADVQSWMKRVGVPGASLAIVRDGKVMYEKGYGMADVENGILATPETVYRLGSVTKQFTAALVLQLVEEGKVKLDEPAGTYLAKMPAAWKDVTVRQLLTHTSGIKNYTQIAGFDKRMRDPVTEPEFFAFLSDQPMDFKPGASWNYSNTNYFLLGLLVEHVTGKKYGDVLQARILQPLHMTHTRLDDPSAIILHRAKGYDPSKSGPLNTDYIDMTWPYAAGSLCSTVQDLAKWDLALYTDFPVKQASLKEGWTRVKSSDGTTHKYGFGWTLDTRNGIAIVQHGGAINGFNASIYRAPSKSLTVIVLCNALPGIADHVASEVLGLVDPSLSGTIRPIEDKDPKTSAFLRSVFTDLIAGTLNRDLFDAKFQALLTPDREKGAHDSLSSNGALKGFDLIESVDKDGTKMRAYRASFAKVDLRVTFLLDASGKISGFQLEPL